MRQNNPPNQYEEKMKRKAKEELRKWNRGHNRKKKNMEEIPQLKKIGRRQKIGGMMINGN